MKTFNFVFSLTIMILFGSTIWISSIDANRIRALPEQTQPRSAPGPLALKITEPMTGQQLNVGKNLTVLGISNYSATSTCGVFVILDGIKPYQKTIPIGQAGGNSYSKWKYTLTPPYNGTIREGTNRITAKLLCQAVPENLTKFYSINVTGVNEIVLNQHHLAIKSNNTTVLPITSNSSQNLPVPKANTSNTSVSSESSGHDHREGSSHHERFSHHHHHKGSSRTNHGYEGGYGGDNYGGDNYGGFGSGYPFYGGGFFGRPY